MVAARASAGAARKSPRRSFRAPDRADRRRQDAGRIPADAGGALRFLACEGGGSAIPRPPHPLHLAAEGARGRYRAQPGNADRRDGPADQGRDPHRRHPGVAAAAAAALSAGHPADHARATGAVAVVRRRAVSVRAAQAHRARRAARARDLQARRSVVARAGAAVAAGAQDALRSDCRPPSPSRNRWRGFWCRSATAEAKPPISSSPAARRRPSSRCSIRASACPGPAIPRATRSLRSTT